MIPVHEDSIEEPSSAVEDAANGSDKREKVIVGDETLTKSFVEPRYRLGDQDCTKPENISCCFWMKKGFLDLVTQSM